jgi:hypothetical protein
MGSQAEVLLLAGEGSPESVENGTANNRYPSGGSRFLMAKVNYLFFSLRGSAVVELVKAQR